MLAKQVYHTATPYIISASADASLKSVIFYDKIPMKEGVFMSENKLLDLSFEFAVAIVNLVDGVTAPKSSYMTDQLARAGTSVGQIFTKHNMHRAKEISLRNWRLH